MSRMDDKSLQSALETVRSSKEEAEKFAADPEAYLAAQGIDTEGLRFGDVEDGELSEADLELAAGGKPIVCTSVGTGVGVTACSSVGDDGAAY